MKFVNALIGCALIASVAVAAPEADRVEYLPEMGRFDDYAMYSGYVQIPAEGKKELHYMFVESQNDPATDPVIIWYNGGPGCSSMLAFSQEHGPYVIPDGEQNFVKNEYSWNREANMLYIEAPAGVGYSYGETVKDRTYDDTLSAKDNLEGILAWFEKFPEYQSHDLYISGESYGGIYVPLVSYNIDQYNEKYADDDSVFKPNLKGFMVGNGVTNWEYDTTPAFVQLAYDECLFDTPLMDTIKDLGCKYGYAHPFIHQDEQCRDALLSVYKETDGINTYNTYGICYGPEPHPQLYKASHGVTFINGVEHTYKRHYTAADYTPWLYQSFTNSNGAENSPSIPPCIYGTPVADYLNRQDIRELLHIPDYVQAWELCTDHINYETSDKGSQWAYEALRGKYRVLKFSGDTDGSVPTVGTRAWINSTGWKITEAYRPYKLDNQIAGYVEERENWFTFGSVHGAGHMAPQYKPPQTYHLVFNWLHQRDI